MNTFCEQCQITTVSSRD